MCDRHFYRITKKRLSLSDEHAEQLEIKPEQLTGHGVSYEVKNLCGTEKQQMLMKQVTIAQCHTGNALQYLPNLKSKVACKCWVSRSVCVC